MSDEWMGYREEALSKLPKDLQNEYSREDWWEFEDEDMYNDDYDPDEACISRIYALVESYPDLTIRDVFAICDVEIENVPMNMSGTDINLPIVPLRDEARLERVKSIAVKVCQQRIAENENDGEDNDSEVESLLNKALSGELEYLDPIFELVSSGCTLQMAFTIYFVKAFWEDYPNAKVSCYSGDAEQVPFIVIFMRLGLSTGAPIKFMQIC